MDFKYHDTKRAEEMIRQGRYLSKYIESETKILLLYYRDVLGYKPKKREEEFIRWLNNQGINEIPELRYWLRQLEKAKDRTKVLIDIDYIPIYTSEIEYILDLPIREELQKLLFASLVKMKLNKRVYEIAKDDTYDNYFLNLKYSYAIFFKQAGIKNAKMSLWKELIDLGYVEFTPLKIWQGQYQYKMSGNAAEFLIFYDMPVDETEVALYIEDYNNIGLYYDYYIGKNIKFCEKCNKPFVPNSNRAKYCSECKNENKQDRSRACEDCGRKFWVSNKTQTNKCPKCYRKYRKNIINDNAKKYYRKNKGK